MASLQSLLDDPDFQQLTPEEQRELRQRFFQTHMATDPEFLKLPKGEQEELWSRTIGVGRSLIGPPRRTGSPIAEAFEPIGEAMTAPSVVQGMIGGQPGSFRAFAGATVGGLEKGARLAFSPITGVGRVFEQAMEQSPRVMGMAPASTPISRAAGEFPEYAAGIIPFLRKPAAPAPSVITKAQERLRKIPEEVRIEPEVPLPEPMSVPRQKPPTPEIEQALTVSPHPLTEPILKLGPHKKFVEFAGDALVTAGVQRDESKTLIVQILELMGNQRIISDDAFLALLRKHDLTELEFAQQFVHPAATQAGRLLQPLSVVSRRLNRMLGTVPPEMRSTLRALGEEIDETVSFMSWWRRIDNVRRGLLVTQLATSMRNAETQLGRVGIDVMDRVLQAGIRKTVGAKNASDPHDAFEVVLNLFSKANRQRAREVVDAVEEHFPSQYDRLFGTYVSDISAINRRAGQAASVGDKALNAAEWGTHYLNVVNRAQEFWFRRAAFTARLDQNLSKKGLDLDRIIAENRVGAIGKDDLQDAIGHALEMTFAKPPEFGTAGYHFTRLALQVPGATLAFPFPRFLVNSLRYQWEFSPFPMTKFLSPAQAKALLAGDPQAVQTFSRAVIGSGLFGAAYGFRHSEYAGEKWYEARLPNGETLDLRAFNPFATYLFLADVIKHWKDGTMMPAAELAKGIAGVNLRAGTGLYLLDKFAESLTMPENREELVKRVATLGGEVVGGAFMPIQTFVDFYDQFIKSGMHVPGKALVTGQGATGFIGETRSEPFLGPIKARIPGLREQLEPVYSPTREGPVERREPFLRQMTGVVLAQRKTPAGKELDRLGFAPREIFTSTGNPKADNLIKKFLGPLVETQLSDLVESPVYQDWPDAIRGEVLRKRMVRLRRVAVKQARIEEPELFRELKQERMPRWRRAYLQELGLLE